MADDKKKDLNKLSPDEMARLEEQEQVISVMKIEPGRAFMHRLIKMSNQFQSSYNPGLPGNDIYFREGERNMGLKIISELNDAAPELYSKMMEENRNDV